MDTTVSYRCPNCGGSLVFSSKTGMMICPYCDSEFDPAAFDDSGRQQQAAQEPADELTADVRLFTKAEQESYETYICGSCSGQIMVSAGTGAVRCPFCGSHNVIPRAFKGMLKPDLIVPFRIPREQIAQYYLKFLAGKAFVPEALRHASIVTDVQGLYVPFWIFSGEARADLLFRCEKVTRKGKTQYRDIYDVTRAGSLKFTSVPADASKAMDDGLMDSLEPYDLNAAEKFSPAYLSGYTAGRYDVTARECVERVSSRMKNSLRRAMEDTIEGFSVVNAPTGEISVSALKARCVMLPVWIAHLRTGGITIPFAINGQTGKFAGRIPHDKIRYWLTFVPLFVLLWAVSTAIIYLGAIFSEKS